MKRIAIGAIAVVAMLAVAAFAWREPLMLAALATRAERQTLEERVALIEPYIRAFAPENAQGRFPAVLQFHGCSGPSPDHERQFAAIANEAGYIAFSIDSHTPRGIDRAAGLKTVCTGKALIGQERAGDVAAAIDIIRKRSDVDGDRIVLAGWSHGAWTIMDYLTFAAAGRNPPGVDGAAPRAFEGVILFYPYCGPGARARFAAWSSLAPVVAFVAGADEIVDGPQCKALFDRAAAKDKRVRLVYYPSANHVFDHRELAGENRRYFDEESAADAERRYLEFLVAAKRAQ